MSDVIERAKKRIENPPSETRLGFTDAEVWELIAEVERLEYAVEAMQGTANKDKVGHREQIDSLTNELESWKKTAEQAQDKWRKLEAENAELKRISGERKTQVKSLESSCSNYQDIASRGIEEIKELKA